jgi:hypothetical protein
MPSTMICLAAVAIAISPDEHWRSMVCPETVTGNPAASDDRRATFIPAVPAVSTAPMTTSSISSRSGYARWKRLPHLSWCSITSANFRGIIPQQGLKGVHHLRGFRVSLHFSPPFVARASNDLHCNCKFSFCSL